MGREEPCEQMMVHFISCPFSSGSHVLDEEDETHPMKETIHTVLLDDCHRQLERSYMYDNDGGGGGSRTVIPSRPPEGTTDDDLLLFMLDRRIMLLVRGCRRTRVEVN